MQDLSYAVKTQSKLFQIFHTHQLRFTFKILCPSQLNRSTSCSQLFRSSMTTFEVLKQLLAEGKYKPRDAVKIYGGVHTCCLCSSGVSEGCEISAKTANYWPVLIQIRPEPVLRSAREWCFLQTGRFTTTRSGETYEQHASAVLIFNMILQPLRGDVLQMHICIL